MRKRSLELAVATPTSTRGLLAPFLGRRLAGAWCSADQETGCCDVWLAFARRPGAPDCLHLAAAPAQVLPGWIEGGGPTSPCLHLESVQRLPESPGEPWHPFSHSIVDLQAWAFTELWISTVATNILAPGAYRLQEVCGGMALHFSNTAGANSYGQLLGLIQEHHDLDAPPAMFCSEMLPPLAGSGPWRRADYLRDSTGLDDAAVRHFSPHDFGTPALAGCMARLAEALLEFSQWFEREPRAGWLTPAQARRWLDHHRHHLDKVTQVVFYADLILQRSTECGEDLKLDIAALGLGSLFSEAWAERDAACDTDRQLLPGKFWLADIHSHYAPVREAYRQWFVLFRQACTDERRRLVRWTYEPAPEWALTLDAALSRGSLRFDALLEIAGARLLRDDYREPWVKCEEGTWFVKQGELSRQGSQDVLIEGDEEQTDSLRITWWPMLERRDRVITIRAPRDAVIDWGQHRPARRSVSPFEELLAWRAGRSPAPEHWPGIGAIVERAAHPPGADQREITLPPYSEDDVREVFLQCMQGRDAEAWPALRDRQPELAWAYDSEQRFVPLLLGRDVHPLATWSSEYSPTADRVVFPAEWPATWVGCGPFYLMWSQGHWREEKAEGLDFRRYGWLLPIVRQQPATEGDTTTLLWRWGLIDIEGRFVLPCQFSAMGFPQSRNGGSPIAPELPLPSGRREPWCWIWVGETEHADGCWRSDRNSAPGHIVEAWSGALPLPSGLTAWRLDGQFAQVSDATAGRDAPRGLFNLATGRGGPICWRHIDTFCLSIDHAGPAQCFDSGLWTYIDESGEPLLPAEFSRVERIDSGLATVQLGIASAEARGPVLSLPDGTRQSTVGVFGPHGVASLGEWFLQPAWRDVSGEYDGHFVVQDAAGRWGMVTPEGMPVTHFVPRSPRDEINGDIHHQVMEQFKRTRNRWFLDCLRDAMNGPNLGLMSGKLRSSFARYDYGPLTCGEIPVRLVRDVAPEPDSCGLDAILPALLAAGTRFAWRPRQRNYFNNIDLRKHTPIGPRSSGQGESGYHSIHVPWDALALDLPPADCGSTAEKRQQEGLASTEHLDAATRLLDALASCLDLVDVESSSTFSRALEGSRTLHMLLVHLVEIVLLNRSRGHRELILDRLKQDLEKIDFPNLLDGRPEGTVDTSHDSRPPVPRGAWSKEAYAAHETARIAYQIWEAVFRRAVG